MKFAIIFVALSAYMMVAVAIADTHMPTSVMASAGGEASSTNFRMKATLGQSTPIGPSGSTNFEAGAGFWYQDPIAPSAIGDLTASLSIDDIVLEWSHAADNVAIDQYIVYRATDPGFEPSGGNVIGQTQANAYLDPGTAGVVGTDYYYLVKAQDPRGNLAEDSNRVGEFNKDVLNAVP